MFEKLLSGVARSLKTDRRLRCSKSTQTRSIRFEALEDRRVLSIGGTPFVPDLIVFDPGDSVSEGGAGDASSGVVLANNSFTPELDASYTEQVSNSANVGIPDLTVFGANLSSADLQARTLANSSYHVSSVFGRNTQQTTAGATGTVPLDSVGADGWYSITISGNANAVVSAAGASIASGNHEALFRGWLEARVLDGGEPVSGSPIAEKNLYYRSYALSEFLDDETWSTISEAAKTAETTANHTQTRNSLVTAAGDVAGISESVYSGQFTITVTAYLQAGTSYQWDLATHTTTGATALGADGIGAASSLNASIESVSVEPIATPATYTINVSSGANGTISPSGAILVRNSPLTFVAEPNRGYEVEQWTINGAPFASGLSTVGFGSFTGPLNIAVSHVAEFANADLISRSLTVNGEATGISVNPGSQVPVTIDVLNYGTAASGVSNATLYWSTDAEITTEDTPLGSSVFPGLIAGQSNARTIQVTIPNDVVAAETYYLGVAVDSTDQVPEGDWEDNNVSAAIPVTINSDAPPAAPTNVQASVNPETREITLTWDDNSDDEVGFKIYWQASEGDPPPWHELEDVSIGPNEVSATFVPAAGSSPYFQVRAFNSEGETASETIFVDGMPQLPLELAIVPATISEDDSGNVATGTITQRSTSPYPQTILLGSSNTSQAVVPASVEIPAGEYSVTFPVTAVDDDAVDGDQDVTIVASATGFDLASAIVRVLDDDSSARVQIVESDGTSEVEEGGATDTYTVVLASQPASFVVITIDGGDQLETSVDALTFTPEDWDQPQTVTIAAIDDDVDELTPHTGTITHAALSNDQDYNGIAVADVTVSIADDGVPASASVSGVVWDDADRDGELDEDEPLLEGWTVYLDANANGQLDAEEQWTATASDGSYSLTSLSAGTYAVATVVQSGWLQTVPGLGAASHSVTLSIGEALGDVDFGNETYVDLGEIDYHQELDQNAADRQWYRLTTTHQFLTIEAEPSSNVSLRLYDTAFTLLETSADVDERQRIDRVGNAGSTFFAEITGTATSVDVAFACLLDLAATILRVTGTDGDDVVDVNAGQGLVVSVNGVLYDLTQSGVTTVDFDTAAGNDAITLHDSPGNDTIELWPDWLLTAWDDFTLTGRGFEEVTAFSTAGGYDRAKLYDSAGDDRFYAKPDAAWMSGNGFVNSAMGFDRIEAHATAGGYDRAYFYDSPENDRFYGMPENSWISGDGYFNWAMGFDRVEVQAANGGDDNAFLYDSAGDDRFYRQPEACWVSGSGFVNVAIGFGRVEAHATAGGYDRAYFYDSSGDDRFYANPETNWMSGSGFFSQASGFDRVEATASAGGYDRAYLYGSPGDDRFNATPDGSWFNCNSFVSVASGFERVEAHVTAGGYDRAYLYDSPGDDRFYGKPESNWVSGEDFVNVAVGFDRVEAHATSGGYDQAFLYDSSGDDRYYGDPDASWISGSVSVSVAYGFDHVDARATAGGYDRAYLYDSIGDDRFTGKPESSWLSGTGFANVTIGFDRVEAHATSGGYDRAYLHDSAGDDRFYGRLESAWLSGSGFVNSANAFDYVDARATAGGFDRAEFYDSTGDDRFFGKHDVSWIEDHQEVFINLARGFDRVEAYATAGGVDVANLYDTGGDDEFHADGSASEAYMVGGGVTNQATGFREINAFSTAGGTDQVFLTDVRAVDTVFGRDSYLDWINAATDLRLEFFEFITAVAASGETPEADVEDVTYTFVKVGPWN